MTGREWAPLSRSSCAGAAARIGLALAAVMRGRRPAHLPLAKRWPSSSPGHDDTREWAVAENNLTCSRFVLDLDDRLPVGTSSSRSVKEALEPRQRSNGERERRSGRRGLPIADLRGRRSARRGPSAMPPNRVITETPQLNRGIEGMLRTVGQKSPRGALCSAVFLKQLFPSWRQRAPPSFNRGLFQSRRT